MRLLDKSVAGASLLLLAFNAHSHVTIASGDEVVSSRAVIDISVPHGCEDEDTLRVEVELPATFTSVRPMDSVFGKAVLEKDAADVPTKIIWTKAASDRLESDLNYYQFSFRATLPDTPFTLVALPTTQFCLTDDGVEISVSWSELPLAGDHDSHTQGSHPAPTFMLMPVHFNGWNQFTAPDHLHDMSIFDDAEIVWKSDTEAYSANPLIMQMIENDANTGVLSQIHPGETFWVKY